MPRKRQPPSAAQLRRRRVRMNTACGLLLAAALCTAIFAASRLLPAHGQWEYENRREYLELPKIEAPCYLRIDIWYQGEPPQGIQMDNAGMRMRELKPVDVIPDDDPAATAVPGKQLMSLACDIGQDDVPEGSDPDGYVLSLVPMDNMELDYKVRIEPSYENAAHDIRFLTGPDGHRYIYVRASYGRLRDDSGIRILSHLEGPGYQPSVLDHTITGSESAILADMDRVIEYRGIDQSRTGSVRTTVMCGGTGPDGDPVQVNESSQLRLTEWPGYDKEAWDEISGTADVTNLYLEQFQPPRRD